MDSIKVYVETGKKRVFAGAVDWPGWCRRGKDEVAALQALIAYGPRYAQVLQLGNIKFLAPNDVSDFVVTERHQGTSATDFGAPAIALDADKEEMDQVELERAQEILRASWQAFDDAVQRATGRELRKGPRGGGRDLDRLIYHILDADQAYLGRLNWKHKLEVGFDAAEARGQTRQAILDALDYAVNKGLPERGPRGGVLWQARYFVRRVAWHVLDHAWEIEDRVT